MGSSSERHDDQGREKVQCRLCRQWYHRLDVHLNSRHGKSVAEYVKEFSGAPTISEAARQKAARQKAAESQGARFKGTPARPAAMSATPAEGNDDELFKFGVARLKMRADLSDYDKQFVPVHDEKWIPGAVEQRQLEELALAMEDDNNCLIVGPHGIGKSTLVIELAAICNQSLRRVGMDGDVRRADYIGEKNVVVDKASGQAITSWVDGVLPDAAEHGHWLLIDEVDAMPAHIAFVMHGVLEKKRHLALLGDRGRPVQFHKNFRIIATANTLGRGDDSGMYAGTNVMNEAFLDRFGVTIRAEYPAEDTEVNILVLRTGVGREVAKKMVKVAHKIREAFAAEQCFVSVSPRRLIDWAEKTVRLNDVRRAAKLTVVSKMGTDDSKFVDNVIQRYFGGEVA